jgi:hypothetical protein
MMFVYVINRSGARTAVIVATCYGLDSLGFDQVGGGGGDFIRAYSDWP